MADNGHERREYVYDAFTDCGDGSFEITLRDGRRFRIRTLTVTCPYCAFPTVTHICRPVERRDDGA
jgi:hypothetical protein